MALTHPDAQVQAIFSMLEQDRDDAIVTAGNYALEASRLRGQIADLKSQLALFIEPVADVPPAGTVIDVEPIKPAEATNGD